MNAGDEVICIGPNGYALTYGMRYTVLKYEADYYDDSSPSGYHWPAYVKVEDDWGREVWAHANRFVKEGEA